MPLSKTTPIKPHQALIKRLVDRDYHNSHWLNPLHPLAHCGAWSEVRRDRDVVLKDMHHKEIEISMRKDTLDVHLLYRRKRRRSSAPIP